jgi:hypothetical protein
MQMHVGRSSSHVQVDCSYYFPVVCHLYLCGERRGEVGDSLRCAMDEAVLGCQCRPRI